MKYLSFYSLFGLCIAIGCVSTAIVKSPFQPLVASESYTHHLIADEDRPLQYQLFWKKLNAEELQFEVHCKTTGWVGMGFSPNGGMVGSDVVIGWVKDGQANLKDCYASAKSAPVEDAIQDFILIDGDEVDGYTILKFKRKLITCDTADKEIRMGTQYMIFAWNDADPATGNGDWKYHGSQNRIQRTTLLLGFKDESLEEQSHLPSDTYTYSMRFNNIAVPSTKQTYYYCDVFQLPAFEKPTHFVQFEMIVNPKNKKNVHHLLVYECDDNTVFNTPVGQECGKVGLPSSVSSKCMKRMIVAWGIGGPYNYTFPKQAGYRFDKSSQKKLLLLEIHYDNPQLQSGIVDDSGIKFYFTEQLREHDLGLLQLGVDGSTLSLQIPPQSSDTSFTSICYPECTERYFPVEGINVVSGFLHTHLAGRAVKTTLVRNGVAIRELFDNPNYDFNYQFIIDIEPTKLYKGDALITRCDYNTKDRNDFTFFGFSTMDEMCFDFIYYYPRIPALQMCHSSAPQNILADFYGKLMLDGLIPTMSLTQLAAMSQSQIASLINQYGSASQNVVQRFEQFFGSSYNKTFFCGGGIGASFSKTNVLHYKPIRSDIVDENNC